MCAKLKCIMDMLYIYEWIIGNICIVGNEWLLEIFVWREEKTCWCVYNGYIIYGCLLKIKLCASFDNRSIIYRIV